MSKPAGSDGSNLPDSTARPVAGSSEIITRLARDMRNASMFCEGPAVPWMTARDIAEAAVHAAADAHNWRTVHQCPSCNRYFDSPSVCSDGTHTVEQEERVPSGAWPDQSAQHAVLLDEIRELHQENERLRAASPDERLREAALRAVFATVGVLPITGSHGRGYAVGDLIHQKVIAEPEEWADAADAICELHRLAAADREAPDEEEVR